MTKLERILAMDAEIRKGTYPTVQRFCEMFEVKKRTVLDDIKLMKESLGLEIVYDRFHNGYINCNPKKQLPTFQLTHGEIFALTLGKEMLSQYTGTSFEPILRSAIEKINERLSDHVEVDLNEMRQVVRINAGPVIPINKKLFLDLNHACERNLKVSIQYYSASTDEVTTRLVSPYRLLENRSTWYLVAFCGLRQDMRLFALHRIKDYALSEENFPLPAPEVVDKWIDSAFQLEHGQRDYTAKIWFAPHAARYVRERSWHPSQTLQEHEDRSCTITFNTQSLEETKRWILAYGAEAKVLEPVELRELVARELQRASQLYAESESALSQRKGEGGALSTGLAK